MIAVIAVIAFCLGLVVAAEYAALQFMRAAKRQPPPVEEALAQNDRHHTNRRATLEAQLAVARAELVAERAKTARLTSELELAQLALFAGQDHITGGAA